MKGLETQVSDFSSLSSAQLYQILSLRIEVFVVEQDCPYQEVDEMDQVAQHVLMTDQGELAAYARILPPVEDGGYLSIGRVVVSPKYRGYKLGKTLMQESIQTAQTWFPETVIKISAQRYLTDFYQSLGFVLCGEYYLEDDIPHQTMLLQP